METLNASTFKEKVFNFEAEKQWKFAGSLPTIVDFYADWCGPCRMLAPVLEEVAKEYAGKIHIFKVNTELNPELASLFRVRGIPALLFIPTTGKPTLTSGFLPKPELQAIIRDVLHVSEDAALRKAGGKSCCSR